MNMKDFFKKYTKQSKKGFTLVEVIAVIVILSVVSTVTISVVVAVQKTVKDTGDITTQQFSTTQVERFIRNEFQTASKIDVHDFDGDAPMDFYASANDKFLYYDPEVEQLHFKTFTDASNSVFTLTIDQVKDVLIDICPVDTTAADKKGMPYKLIYKIKTDTYTYSGGIVLGNSISGDDDTYKSAEKIFEGENSATIHWSSETDGDNNYPENDPYCITFHSIGSQIKVTSSATSSTESTP